LGRLPVALQRRVLRLWLEAALGPNDPGLTFDHVEAVRGLLAADSPSAAVSLPGGRTIAREYGSLRLAPAARHRRGGVWTVAMSGITPIPMLGVEFLARRQLLGGRLRTGSRGTEVFDAAALGRRLTVRTWRPGDRFQPLGMSATRKLQDFFVDQKIPRAQRGRVPLLVAADGRIAWVVGHRLADPFKVTTRTRRALAITATVSRSRS
jgi:tRNA(Ile)-lysidine synthase